MSDQRIPDNGIVQTILSHFPQTQGVYLFGSYLTDYEREDSDVDLAILLPPQEARRHGGLAQGPCAEALRELLGRPVDLVNLREVDTVFQTRILETGRRIYAATDSGAAEFEMLTLSFYQKLSEERALIIEDILRTGRVLSQKHEHVLEES